MRDSGSADERSNEVSFGGYAVRKDERTLRFAGQAVPLAPKVVDTLVAFLEAPDRVLSKRDLLDRIWPDSYVNEANLTQNVYVLRRLFEEHGGGVRLENVPRRGYRLVALAPVTAAVPAPQPRLEASVRPIRAARRNSRASFAQAALALIAVCGCVALLELQHGRRGTETSALPVRALEHYLLASSRLDSAGPGGLRESARLFEQVAHEVPASPLGFAGLAEAEASLAYFASNAEERARLGARASTHALHATRLDGDSAEAFAALGGVRLSVAHDDPGAEEAFGIALRADPANFHALMWDGTALLNHGRVELARVRFERALAVQPDCPGALASLAWASFMTRDYGAAIARSRQLLRAHQMASIAWLTIANAEVARGTFGGAQPALAFLERQTETRAQALALRSQISALSGRPWAARATLAKLEAQTDPSTLGSWDLMAIAAAYARLGLGDSAFLWLDRVQHVDRPQLARDPRFDQLRSDRRFAALIGA